MDGINNMDNLEGYAPRESETACHLPNGWTEITTPYLDCHNDYIQIYFKIVDDGFLLADGGSTLSLMDEGGALNSPKRKKLLKTTLARYGVTERNGNLQVKATADDFALKKRSLVQVILSLIG